MLRWLCLRSTYYWGFSCTWKITIWWQYGDKGFNINDLLISQWIRISYSTIFEKETTISKEKLQKDIEHCKNQNSCWTSNWTGKKDFRILKFGISNNHEGLTWRYSFNLFCYYIFSTTSRPIMNQNETGVGVYGVLICV